MKKWISILLAMVLLAGMTGCGTQTPVESERTQNLMEGVQASPVSNVENLESGKTCAADFAVRLVQNCFDQEQNTLLSPLSVLYALAMTANGANGETLAQMEEVLGMDVADLNAYLHTYRNQLSEEELILANSVWFKDDPSLTVQESFLQTNADYYGAAVYQAPFDDSTVEQINSWVEENTDGMIQQILDQIPEEAVLYLVNALSFEAQWEDIYMEHQIKDGTFTTEDGEQRQVQMMYSEERAYLEDESATGFIKYYEGRDYAFVALLSKEGVTVEEYLAGLTGEHLTQLLSQPQKITTFTRMPKFEMEYDVEMSGVLESMGMTDAFDWTVADFSQMGSSTDGNICISRVLHKTSIRVDESGTKAGAASMAEMVAEGCEEDTRTVILDRPFVYLIVDCEENVPIFLGTMLDPDQTGVTGEPTTIQDHTHTPAEESQTIQGSNVGYCGNTLTTLWIEDQGYTFMGSDSVWLTDLVSNLEYDPEKVCKCRPDYTVETEFGETYGVSLSYVRCEDGQADLTEGQMERLCQILQRLEDGTEEGLLIID